jgi:hypothetical protein
MKNYREFIEDIEKDKEIMKSFIPKDSLSLEIFNKTKNSYVIKEEIREKLLEITNAFLDFIGIDFFIYDIHFTGSLANYNWSNYSDLDIHILVDIDEFDSAKSNSIVFHEIIKEFFELKKKAWAASNDITVKGFEVEFYVQDIDSPGVSTGVYSILNNDWVVEPKQIESAFDLDDKKILEKSEEYGKLIDNLEKSAEEGNDVIKQVDELKSKLKKFRQTGLEVGGEYSYENLTFKLLRRNGYIEKLFDIKTKVRNKKLSLPQ